MNENIVIGIEGLVGSGKTSICKELLNVIPNSIVVHGGNIYRAVTYGLMKLDGELQNDINKLKQKSKNMDIKKVMDLLKIEIKIENRETVVYIDGKKISEEELQSEKASMAVSVVANSADNKNLYCFGGDIIKRFKEKYNVILSGRALMEIYPDLNYHFLITASLEERIKRKNSQYNGKIDIERLKEHILKRDELQEKSGFYKEYDKTIKVDVTDCKDIKTSTNRVFKYINDINVYA